MPIIRRSFSLLLLIITFAIAAGAQVGAGQSLGDVARELRAQKAQASGQSADTSSGIPSSLSQPRIPPANAPAENTAAPASAKPQSPAPQPASPTPAAKASVPAQGAPAKAASSGSEVSDVTGAVAVMTWRKDYAGIDKMADDFRASKARFAGGAWKLYTLYAQLGTISQGSNATDADWQQFIAFFQDWIKARPQSITARVALANAYLAYAWQARGQGSADQVTDAGWKLFHDRNQAAANTLMDARNLPSGCPEWYLVFQMVGRSEGADKEELKTIFDRAVAYEPDYYYFYQEYAEEMLPKWAGEPGDMEKFAADTYNTVGGKKGAFLYFQIASSLCDECGDFTPDSFSWPTIQEGFSAMEEMYGASTMKLNQYARLAAAYNDKDTAARVFARIGDNWDQSVWGTRAGFDAHRAWAGMKVESAAAANQGPTMPAATQQQVAQLMQSAGQATMAGRLPDAATALRKIIGLTKDFPSAEGDMMRAYTMLARNQHSQGQDNAARATLDEALALMTKTHGENSAEVAGALSGRAMVESQMNDAKGAEADIRKAIAIQERAGGPLNVQLVFAYAFLGQVYQQQDRNQDAVKVLEPLLKRIGDDPAQAAAAPTLLSILASAYEAMGRHEDAAAAYTRLLKTLQASLPPGSAWTRDTMGKLAQVYHAMGRKDDEAKIEAELKAMDSAGAQ